MPVLDGAAVGRPLLSTLANLPPAAPSLLRPDEGLILDLTPQ